MQPFFAQRFEKVEPSFIREILKVAANPEIISFAGGLPNPHLFPVKAIEQACQDVLREQEPPRCNTPPPRALPRCASSSPIAT